MLGQGLSILTRIDFVRLVLCDGRVFQCGRGGGRVCSLLRGFRLGRVLVGCWIGLFGVL